MLGDLRHNAAAARPARRWTARVPDSTTSTRRALHMSVYARPGAHGVKGSFKARYEHYIGGGWVAPVKGEYYEKPTPVTGKVFTAVARYTAEDNELALESA